MTAYEMRISDWSSDVCSSDLADADDLVQETLIKAIDRAELFRPGADLRAWLFGILHNTFLSSTRTAARRRSAPVSDTEEVFQMPPNQEAHAELHRVLAALQRLPEEQRQVIVMVSVDGFTTDEAADALGLPVGTVRSRLWRGREALRRISRGEDPKVTRLRLVGGHDVHTD